jgi:hypothetical protein
MEWRSEFTIRSLPLDGDDHLFAVLVNPPTKEVFELIQKNLMKIYVKSDNPEAAIMSLLKKIEAAEDDKKKAALLIFISDICHKLEDAIKELPFERHGTMKDISGSFCVSIQFPETEVFALSLDKSLRISTIPLGLSPWLRVDPSRFCLQYGQKTLSNTSHFYHLGICANSKLRVVESQEAIKTPQISIPSQFLAREDFVRKLLDTLVAPHLEEFYRDCEKLLDYLPSDQTIKNVSANPEPFLAKLKTIDNQHILVYHLQILRWRIQFPFYLNQYKSAGLTDLLPEFLQTTTRSAGVIVNI